MTEKEEPARREKSVRELRETLADVLNAASVHGEITYVTSRGRPIALVGPLSLDRDAMETQPRED